LVIILQIWNAPLQIFWQSAVSNLNVANNSIIKRLLQYSTMHTKIHLPIYKFCQFWNRFLDSFIRKRKAASKICTLNLMTINSGHLALKRSVMDHLSRFLCKTSNNYKPKQSIRYFYFWFLVVSSNGNYRNCRWFLQLGILIPP
jgi:hypothetical protein